VRLNLFQLFSYAAERYPDRDALIQDDKVLSYSQLAKEVDRVASSLHQLGLRAGERVMVLLKNRIETVVLFWAVQKLGAVFTPINLRLSSEDIQYCVNDLETRFIVFEEASRSLVTKQKFFERPLFISLEEDRGDISYSELVKKRPVKVEPQLAGENDLAVILYTSGTSGRPKGVPRTHRNEYSATMAHIIQSGNRPFDKTLGIAALSHAIGLQSLLIMTALNGVYYPMPNFDPGEALTLISFAKVSSLILTPTMFHDLVYHPNAKQTDFSSVYSITYTGGPMKKEVVKKCNELIQPEHFVNQYGSTEIYTFSVCSDVREKPDSAGRPGINQRVRIIRSNREREATPDDLVKKGVIGEIIIDLSSPEAFKGYWNRPDATRRSIKDGWYFTGDIGFVDVDGDLYVIGRADDMIISAGENIYPQEIENILMEHPYVREAAVIGEEDERWGEMVTAFIVPASLGLSPQTLDYFCKVHKGLPSYKRPRKYVFVNEVPKNSAGKILRRKLRDGTYPETSF
jgi:2-furoate---CoA ligase